MLLGMQRLTFTHPHPLYNAQTLRVLEARMAANLPPHTLMQRAGLSVARLAMAIAPHAKCIWIACGPGNNGGDGFEAALHLHQWGKSVVVTCSDDESKLPADATLSLRRARAAHVEFRHEPPDQPDLCIDALLGIGSTRPPTGKMADWLAHMASCQAPVLCVDLPTGLNANTGENSSNLIANYLYQNCRNKVFTLTFLGLKPGLFTHQGRDACGEIWWDDLGASTTICDVKPDAWLAGPSPVQRQAHASHKGSYGDVLVVGGDTGMLGAAMLAADAALHAGAGRVYVSLLDLNAAQWDNQRPALMFRNWQTLDLSKLTLVCGCGGGTATADILTQAIPLAGHLVMDADALNLLATDLNLQTMLVARGASGKPTVLTPHPLEAARLLGTSVATIQSDRLKAALQLAERYQCTVALKGSGTVVASQDNLPSINPTGNARLATAGTGDVLAGLVGARLAHGLPPREAAMSAAWQHGFVADLWPAKQALTADQLAQSLLR